MDKTQARELAAAVTKAINDAGIVGFTLGKQGGSYDGEGMNIRIRMNALSDDGTPTTPERTALLNMSEWEQKHTGLRPDMLDKPFMSNGKSFTVTGYAANRPKYPIIGKRISDGKQFKFTISTQIKAIT